MKVEKHPHPLEYAHPHLYNPVTGQMAPAEVNVADSIQIGEKVEIASLSNCLYCCWYHHYEQEKIIQFGYCSKQIEHKDMFQAQENIEAHAGGSPQRPNPMPAVSGVV